MRSWIRRGACHRTRIRATCWLLAMAEAATLTGVSKANPHAHKVVVGTNPLKGEMESGTLVITTSRFNLMEPANSQNLDLFLQQQRLAGSFGLAPVTQGLRGDLVPATDLVIGKTEIVVRTRMAS